MIAAGNTFLVPSGPEGKKHLFVLALGPLVLSAYGKQPHVVLVSFTSIHKDAPFDDACVIEAGEHPFIRHRSYVAYRYMRIDPLAHIEALSARGWQRREDCSLMLLKKIIVGAGKSKHISRELKEIFSALS
jgi:hypothetical protein